MRATDILRREHEQILQGLGLLGSLSERLATGAVIHETHIARLIDYFRQFADGCHHAKEEGLLFPKLEQSGLPPQGPTGMMRHEHGEARALLHALAEAIPSLDETSVRERFVQVARDYVELMSRHIAKENQVLFRIADQMLGPKSARELADAFAHIDSREQKQFQIGTELMRELQETYSSLT